MNPKPQTPDPGESHSTNSKNGGMVDFTGQDPYDTDGGEGKAGDDTEITVRVSNTSNPCNGSGGTRKVFSPNKVKGSNP